MAKSYLVSLEGVEGLPSAGKIAAEVSFIKQLERSLGSEEAVVEVYRAWMEASESDATEVSKEIWALAAKWSKAFEAAQRAGLKNIGEGDAHFELHLESQGQAH